MPRITDKLAPRQFHILLSRAAKWPQAAVRIFAVLADEEDLMSETTVEEATSEEGWAEVTCEAIRDHAMGCGRGAWRYAVRIVRDDDRVVGSTWCRVVVRASDVDEEGDGLDGSVGSYVQQLQKSLDQQQRMNLELQRTQVETFKAQGEMMRQLYERQTRLEQERADLVAASLADAAERAQSAGGEDEMLGELLKLLAPAIGEKLAEKFVPMLIGGATPKSDVEPTSSSD